MIEKDITFKLFKEEKEPFHRIKQAIVEAPSLKSSNFEKEFILYVYTFTSDTSYTAILTQKNNQGESSYLLYEL
jgi:hypothetical protein